jgi:hypothetical protein
MDDRTPVSRFGERWSTRSQSDRRWSIVMLGSIGLLVGFIAWASLDRAGWELSAWLLG